VELVAAGTERGPVGDATITADLHRAPDFAVCSSSDKSAGESR
jgi:hypothetical protein